MNASAIAGGRFAAGPALREGSRARPRASSALDVRAGRRISAPRTSSLAADRGAMMASRHCAISAARPRGLIVRSAAADAGGLSSGGGGDVPADVQAALYKLCCPGEGVQLLTGEARGEAPPIDTTAVLRSAGMGLLAMGAAVHTGGLAGAWTDLTSNKVFMCGFWAWLLAQVLKVFTNYLSKRSWDWKMLMASGGMPSSHSSLCVGVTTAIAMIHGLNSHVFPVSLAFSLIVMYDAAGVRRHAGKQAEALNKIMAEVFEGHPITDKQLKEVLGHTPLQVICGMLLGVAVPLFLFRFVW